MSTVIPTVPMQLVGVTSGQSIVINVCVFACCRKTRSGLYSALQLYRRLSSTVDQRGPESAQRLILHALSRFSTAVSDSATANRVTELFSNAEDALLNAS